MPRRQTSFPQWWIDLPITERQREKIKASFTVTADGYVAWHKRMNKTVFACGRKTPVEEVEDRWKAKVAKLDADARGEEIIDATDFLYRDALAEFLNIQKSRIHAKRNRIEERTYHNYEVALNAFGNFVVGGSKIADLPINEIGPIHFTAYAATFNKWKASGFDSVVSRVGALFRWAQQMDYIDRFRPGPQFRRPAKQDIRDQRIDLTKSFTPEEVATLYSAASHTIRCWIALGICAAFNNSDIGNVTRNVIDLDTGIIDFRRRKKGKERRVIPLPPDVVSLLKWYNRPDPVKPEWDDLFFLTEEGNPYTRTVNAAGEYKPSDSISRLFARLLEDVGVSTTADGKNFSGLRTTHYNLAPNDKWEFERKVVMGHAKGTVALDSYLERLGVEELRKYVEHVWSHVRTSFDKLRHSAP